MHTKTRPRVARGGVTYRLCLVSVALGAVEGRDGDGVLGGLGSSRDPRAEHKGRCAGACVHLGKRGYMCADSMSVCVLVGETRRAGGRITFWQCI